jgi:hypothetical protein
MHCPPGSEQVMAELRRLGAEQEQALEVAGFSAIERSEQVLVFARGLREYDALLVELETLLAACESYLVEARLLRSEEYEALRREVLRDIAADDFRASWTLCTARAVKLYREEAGR